MDHNEERTLANLPPGERILVAKNFYRISWMKNIKVL